MDGVYGSLATVLRVRGGRIAWTGSRGTSIADVNADLLYRRLWIGELDKADVNKARLDQLAQVAAACGALPTGLLDGLLDRRAAAARQLAAATGGLAVPVRLEPLWRMVIGHGEDTVQETSLIMSPTYGVPIIPGSALKGVASAQARAEHGQALPGGVARLFGTPRPGMADADSAQGTVVVFDALPTTAPAVVVDVLTPHVQPYYSSVDADGVPSKPPAEYHNPIPVRFLAVERTPFQAWLIGSDADVGHFVELLGKGADDLGIGGKTAAGYGYCTVATP